jgi:hypothetical protein
MSAMKQSGVNLEDVVSRRLEDAGVFVRCRQVLFVATEMDMVSGQKCLETPCARCAVLYRMLTRGQRRRGLSLYLRPRISILTHVRSGRSALRRA